MRTIAHLSDLHFGRVDPTLLDPLREKLARLKPDLVVVSGDLTQRARARQFREARAFLDTLPRPQVVVPGNHDVPLWNVFARFLRPYAGFRRAISELEPSYVDEEIAVFGVTTAHGFTTKHGHVSDGQLARLRARLAAVRSGQVKMLVMHHFLPQLPSLDVDVFVAGHVHATRVAAGAALVVEAGTATSRRTRAEPNAFNVLVVSGRQVRVEHYEHRGPGGWVAAA